MWKLYADFITEEVEERYGLTKEDLSEFQQESHVAIAKTLQMVEAA